MSLTELGALGEVVGAIAVVITLFYLSQQVKANTAALRAANAAAVQENFQKLASLYTDDREAGELVIRRLELDETMKPAERAAAYGWFFNCLKAGELAYRQFKSGQLDDEVWEVALVHFRAYWETPGMRQYWEERRYSFIPAFREAMDGWLSGMETGPLTRSDHFFQDSTRRPEGDGERL